MHGRGDQEDEVELSHPVRLTAVRVLREGEEGREGGSAWLDWMVVP